MSWELEVVQGAHQGARIPLGGGEVTLGRDQQATFVLQGDPGIARVHSRVFVREGICYVVDMSGGGGTYLNGSAVSGAPMQMRSGDTIAMSSTVIRLLDTSVQAMQPSAPQQGDPGQVPAQYQQPGYPPQGQPQQPGYPPQGQHPPQTMHHPQQQPMPGYPPQGQHQYPPQPHQQQPYGSQPQNANNVHVSQNVNVVQQSSSTGWWIALVIILVVTLGPCGLLCLGVAIMAILPYVMLLGGTAMGITGLVMWNKYKDSPGWESQSGKGMTLMIIGFIIAGLGLLWVIAAAAMTTV